MHKLLEMGYNFTQPLIRYHISDQLVLHEATSDADCPFTKADVLLCRDEDVLWFEKPDGSKEYLHPLSMEGFCVDGLLDYQFCQTSETSFEMLAEAEESAVQAEVTKEICRQVRKLLADKELEEIQFSVRFVEQIIPDKHTGKKSLIIKKMEDTDLSFEYSDVEANVKGHIVSVKNSKSNHIIADSVGEIIRGDAVMERTGEVILREETEKKGA